MRFYLDENLPVDIVPAARRLGLDVTCSRDYGRNGTTDEEQLAFAAEMGRCIVTRDRVDFENWSKEFLESNRPHAGALITPAFYDREIGAIAEALRRFDEESPDGVPAYLVRYLKRAR